MDAEANANAGGSTIALCERYSVEVIKCLKILINHYKLLNVSSERGEREKNQQFQTLKMDKIPATTQIFLAQIMKFPDFSLTFLVFKKSLTNLQNSLTFP